ncbi:PQ loop repeat-containing protein [Candidatus Nitrososphaera gargensis Ga9.2]|uniref:PQ loop repeat-containing protein n=1 Tax=Nitrososphaera gargensis (strain Ga9.2) TaxID=1237085 RepID=K0I9X1_NITGG|nr:SemiSWEET transporter [Candidatus Nitrososphaera gargensis]AFU58126.1 PQ loop repeat-containing protein [Candidatus Nitrososphaera gargensis Ga9.2]
MEIDTIVGISAAILTMSSFIPQIIKAIKTRSMEDVSVYLMPLFIVGFSLWVAYGFMQDDPVIIGSNITGIAFNTTLLFLKSRYKMTERRAEQ